MPEKKGQVLAIYKVVRMFKLKHLGRIMSGRFVWCRAIFAKNYVTRHELIRCRSKRPAKQDAVQVNAIWIDTIDDPNKPNPEPKAEAKAKHKAKPKPRKKSKGKAKSKGKS